MGKRVQPGANDGAGAKPKTPRCTEKEYERRMSQASDWMLLGWTDKRVAAELAAKYRIGTKQAANYVADVKKRWADEARARAEMPPEDIVKEHCDRFRMLMVLSVKDKSYKTAIMAAERLAQLEGLLTTKSVQHTGKVALEINPEVDAAADAVLSEHGYTPPAPAGPTEE